MVESQQHQEPVKHAIEDADQAILGAQWAEHSLQQAETKADPDLIQSAQARLKTAQAKVTEAQEHLAVFEEKYGQQIKQTQEQLTQASQDLKASEEAYHTPRQIR